MSRQNAPLVPKIAPAIRGLVVGIDEVQPHPRNPRSGDVGAITESLRRFGQTKPIVAQESTGYVLAGNHTWKAAKALGWTEIAVVRVDMDDSTAIAYAIADNRTQELGSYDEDVLTGILSDLAAAGQLDGTGYDGDDVDALVAKLKGEDNTKTYEVHSVYQVIVTCEDETSQLAALEQLMALGLEVKALTV